MISVGDPYFITIMPAQAHMAPWEALLTDKENLSSMSNDEAEAKRGELTRILSRYTDPHAAPRLALTMPPFTRIPRSCAPLSASKRRKRSDAWWRQRTARR